MVVKISAKKPLNNKQRYVVSSLLFLGVAAIVLTWFLEYRYFLYDMFRVWSFTIGSPLVFFFNAFILWLIMVFVWGLVGSPTITVGGTWVFIIILTYIHINKYYSRQTPILPEDFQLASEAHSLAKFVDSDSIVRLIIAIIMGR